MKRFNAVYKGFSHNVRVIADNKDQALTKLLTAGYKLPIDLILVCGIDSQNFKAIVE